MLPCITIVFIGMQNKLCLRPIYLDIEGGNETPEYPLMCPETIIKIPVIVYRIHIIGWYNFIESVQIINYIANVYS